MEEEADVEKRRKGSGITDKLRQQRQSHSNDNTVKSNCSTSTDVSLLKPKPRCKRLREEKELQVQTGLALTAVAAAAAGSPADGGKAQPQQQQHEGKYFTDLPVEQRLPLLRSFLLPASLPSLVGVQLSGLANEVRASAPTQAGVSTGAAGVHSAETSGDRTTTSSERGEEAKALLAFLVFLKDALESAPSTEVEFEKGGLQLRNRSVFVPLKRVVGAASADVSRKGRNRNFNSSSTASSSCSANTSRHSSCGSSKLGKCRNNSVSNCNGECGGKMEDDLPFGEGKRAGFRFEAPVQIHIVGSAPLQLCCSFNKNIDVCAMMPRHSFIRRDHLNYRYFNKRNVYVQLLYEHLRKVLASFFPPADASSSKFKSGDLYMGASPHQLHVEKNATTDAAVKVWESAGACRRALPPLLIPRVFLQMWQGSLQKPVIAIRFIASGALEQQQTTHEQRLQNQLKEWVIRVLLAPATEDAVSRAAIAPGKDNGSSSNVKSSSRNNSNKPIFQERLLHPQRNCVRMPTTCVRNPTAGTHTDYPAPYKAATAACSEKTAAAKEGPPHGVSEEEQQQDLHCEGAEEMELPPTPFYNALLLEDMRLRQHQRLLFRCCQEYGDIFRQAVLLLKLWGHRRGFMGSRGSNCSTGSVTKQTELWTEVSGLNGFTLSMLCCHACLTAAASSTPLTSAQQLLSLTFSFLANADFFTNTFVLGDPQPYSRLDSVSSGFEEAPSVLAVTAAGSGAAAVGTEKDSSLCRLAAGLSVEACIYDSPSRCFNILWRAQLHVHELQQEARSSLFALQNSRDPLPVLFRPGVWRAFSSTCSSNSNSSSDKASSSSGSISASSSYYGEAAAAAQQQHLQEKRNLALLLQDDVQIYISQVPLQPELYVPDAAYPMADYLPYYLQRKTVAAADGRAVQNFLASLDSKPKWETPPPLLLAASLLRVLVRGLNNRLKSYRVRLRLRCCACAGAAAADPAISAESRKQKKGSSLLLSEEEEMAMAGQPLAWTAETFGSLIRKTSQNLGLTIALSLDAANVSRIIDRGPSAAIAAAATGATADFARCAAESFKLFWGPEKVETRRFQDSQILLAVLWKPASSEELLLRSHLLPSMSRAENSGQLQKTVQEQNSKTKKLIATEAAHSVRNSCEAATIPPPHTQIITHLIGRHFSQVLLLPAEDEQQKTTAAVVGEMAARLVKISSSSNSNDASIERSSAKSVGNGTVVKTDGKAYYEKAAADSSTRVGRGLCWLMSTPLGGVAPVAERQRQLIKAFNELRNIICSLSSLPLSVKQVWHSSPALRFTDARPLWYPEDNAHQGEDKDHDYSINRVVIEFENSSAWPDEPEAIHSVKTAFLLAMRKELLTDHGLCGTVSAAATLDVSVGIFVFRIIIFHPVEVAAGAATYAELNSDVLWEHLKQLACRNSNSSNVSVRTRSYSNNKFSKGKLQEQMRQQTEEKEMLQQQQQQKQLGEWMHALDAEEEDDSLARPLDGVFLSKRKTLSAAIHTAEEGHVKLLRQVWWEPQVAAVLHACALRDPAFAGGVRLIKRWIGEMLLPGCIRICEHILVTVFIDYLSQGFSSSPQSAQVGFLRFLHLVDVFEWETQPLFVRFDPKTHLSFESEQLIKRSFDRFRRYPSVHSIFDPHSFIIPRPQAFTFSRLVRNARAALAAISLIPTHPSIYKAAFKRSFTVADLQSFDFLLFLRKNFTQQHEGEHPCAAPSVGKPHFSTAAVQSYVTADNSNSGGETEALLNMLLVAATGGSHKSVSTGSALFNPCSVKRYMFLRLLRAVLQVHSTDREGKNSELYNSAFVACRDALALAYNPLSSSLLGGGMPSIVAVKMGPLGIRGHAHSLVFARPVQPGVTLPRCCYRVGDDIAAAVHQFDGNLFPCKEATRSQNILDDVSFKPCAADNQDEKDTETTEPLIVDCLNPVLVMSGLFAAGGELVERIQIGAGF